MEIRRFDDCDSRPPIMRWRMFEPCKNGLFHADCAEEVVDGDGKTARCACSCHTWKQLEGEE